MEETLGTLERQRESLYQKLRGLGDFRRGTISANYRKCGRKNCVCAKPGHPGHGSQYLWNSTHKGKSYAKNLKLGPEVQKYMKEIASYRRFLSLCEELVEVNEKICNLRPVVEIEEKDEREELKKKLQRFFKTESQRKWTVS